ncbi:L-pipecolate oxidase [Litchfieldella rifensis]|uniref:NAD(P)/FAD-dependent oxidoreductase n=1 Tax=Litchfieldella rifensis TaxID=762643 RepID=A0ABV7LTE9_9GAMM
METRCLWEATSRESPIVSSILDSQQDADVCIIGGGITGLSTALHLAEQGITVSLIEAKEIPSGGSGRSVGLVNAGLWIPPDDIVKTLGKESGERVNAILGNAPGEVFDIIEKHNIACDATRTGTLHLAHNAKGAKELARRRDQLQSRGAPVELIGSDDCQRLTGTERIEGALLDRRAGTLNPTAYTRGLARAAQSAGADIYTQSPVLRVDRAKDGWRATTPKGSITAQRIVLATNAYTEDAWNQVRNNFFPGYFFQVASRPLADDTLPDILPERQGAWDTRTVLSSIRRDSEGRLILGSLGRGDGKPLSYIKCWANRVRKHYFSQLGEVEWECTWTGRIAFTPDHTLRLFEPAPGILAVTGYNGRGITTGTVVGKGFAHYIVNNDDRLLPLKMQPSRPISGRQLWKAAYETGFSLYHAGQCLKILI